MTLPSNAWTKNNRQALKDAPNSKLEYKNYDLFRDQNDQIDSLFMTKTAEKSYSLGVHILI